MIFLLLKYWKFSLHCWIGFSEANDDNDHKNNHNYNPQCKNKMHLMFFSGDRDVSG